MNWKLVIKYISGKCSPEEERAAETWMRENPDHRQFMNLVDQIWSVSPGPKGQVDVRDAWENFRKTRISANGEDDNDNGIPIYQLHEFRASSVLEKRNYKAKTRWYASTPFYATVAVAALVLAIFFSLPLEQITQPTFQIISTELGERSNITLNDGTRVTLNSDSQLKIPSDYGENDRTLYLEGEAYFDVRHEEERPFIVYSGDVYTEDLGTQFNIKAFPGEEMVEVVVAEGEVELGYQFEPQMKSKKTEPVHLVPNQRVVVNGDGISDIQRLDNLSMYIGWVNGMLVFQDTPFGEVIRKIERWFNVACSVNDPELLKQPFTASFKDESLSNILKMIEFTLGLEVQEVQKEKRTIRFIAR